jgi:TonB family protein
MRPFACRVLPVLLLTSCVRKPTTRTETEPVTVAATAPQSESVENSSKRGAPPKQDSGQSGDAEDPQQRFWCPTFDREILANSLPGVAKKESIRTTIRAHIADVKRCYELQLVYQPEMRGRLLVQFVIASTGQVAWTRAASSQLGNATVDNCVRRAICDWAFEPPSPTGTMLVEYPFVF